MKRFIKRIVSVAGQLCGLVALVAGLPVLVALAMIYSPSMLIACLVCGVAVAILYYTSTDKKG